MLYTLIKYLHIISIFGFLLSHGVSVQVAFALKREHDLQKIRTLLSLSKAPYLLMIMSLLASIVFGVIAGFQGHWWNSGWIWVSIALLVVIFTLMYFFGTNIFGAARDALALPSDPSGTNKELLKILEKSNPILLTIIGYGGYAIIAWLMMFKPF
jgi:ABC-type uncharacterized transport system permease subunit